MKVLLAILLISTLCYCNETENKKAPVAQSDSPAKNQYAWLRDTMLLHCDGAANLVVSEADALKMIASFADLYDKDPENQGSKINAMQKSFWMSAESIRELKKWFDENPDYNGLSFHFGANPTKESDQVTYPPPYQNKTELYIFPTKDCNPGESYGNTWMRIPIKSSYMVDYKFAKPRMAVYNNVYVSKNPVNHKTGISFTKSIWIKSCAIYFLEKLLKNKTTVDGFDVALAAYNTNLEATSRPTGVGDLHFASTMLIVPTESDHAGGHTRNYEIMDAIHKQNLWGGALNHGEICPQNCPDDCKP